jgi:alkanesulfonate monooxygenase SsuD/methylene tetrahydromethanopterin reductase-like flavin-dependent oxidoreductase (luciferase family)
MTDYGRPLQFGYFLIPEADNTHIIEDAQRIEGLGFDLIGVQDHPYQRRFHDTWTLMSVIAARTEHVRIFPDVVNLPLRPPAVLAKAAASLDILSGGRFELGIGAGGFWDAIEAYGGEKRTPGDAFDALEEAIKVIRLIWSGERGVRFEGKHYQLSGAQSGPVPAHPINIWVGAVGPRMMKLIGRSADGWVPSLAYVPPSKLKELQARIDEAAVSAGRDPASIQRLLNIGLGGGEGGMLSGPVSTWADDLVTLTQEYGVDTFVLAGDRAAAQQFAEVVVPEVKREVERVRG